MFNYAGIFKIRIQFYALIFLCLNFISSTAVRACCCGSEPFCSPFSCLKSHTVFPVDTESAGGANTIDNPAIGVQVYRCNFYSTEKVPPMILHSGDIKSSTGSPAAHTYYAQIESNSNVCGQNSKCAYVNGCSQEIKNAEPFKGTCPSGGPYANCDPQVASITINMCNTPDSNGNPVNKMVGMCAYVSKDTGYETALNEIFDAAFVATIVVDPVIAMNDYLKGQLPSAFPSGFSLLGCYPMPVAPLPPPFCKESFSSSSPVSVLRICAEGEEPFKILYSSTTECVKPRNNMKSTFMHPCVRVTFNNPTPSTAISYNTNPDYYNYYTADWKEILYKITDPTITNPPKIRYASLYDASKGITYPPSSSLTAFGINSADYADICGNVNTDGSITASTTSVADPISGTLRYFTLTLPCTDPSDNSEICLTPEDRFKKPQICIYEKRDDKEVLQGCVDRPEMDKPKVSFCENTFNDKTSTCMKVTAATSETTTADYTFEGSTGTCTDTPADGAQQLCLLNTDNPFGFQAILTNRCYVNMKSIQQNTSAESLCYSNNSSCTSQNRSGCKNCFMDEYCGKLGTDSTTSEITGAERLCLFAYTDMYTSLSPEWCKDDQKNSVICNRVCANIPDGSYYAYIDIDNRTIPTTKTPSPLTESCPYSKSSSRYIYRVRNPIEEGLCVDAYTINFNKECKGGQTEKNSKLCKDMKSFCAAMKIPQRAQACKKAFDKACTSVTFPTELCNNVKAFCSTTTAESPNHYEHFDDCQAAFKDCLANPNSPTKKQLGTDITYTCIDLSQIIS